MPWSRVALPVGALIASAMTACGASAATPRDATGRATTTAGGALAAPSAAGPAVLVVWRTGRDVHGAALDGSGARRLLRLPGKTWATATPAPDGTRVAFLDGDRLRTLQVADGGIRELGTVRSPTTALRWSPDGTRVAAVTDGGLVVCAAGPVASGCRRWSGRLQPESGATWSPDGRAVAVIRFPEPTRGGREQLIVTVADGRTSRTIERYRPSAHGTRYPLPLPPVWTRAGLAWSVLDLRLEDGELAGITRARVLLRRAGRTRALTSGPPTAWAFQPFGVAGETADGALLGVRTRMRRTASTFDLRTLVPGDAPRTARVALGTFDPEMGNASAEVLGTLADGRIAVAVRPAESAQVRLHLAVPGQGAGPVLRRADEVAVATAWPGNPVEG